MTASARISIRFHAPLDAHLFGQVVLKASSKARMICVSLSRAAADGRDAGL